MNLLHELQESISKDDSDLGPIFLRLRIFADKLGSAPFLTWIKRESEGYYPHDIAVPDYRIVQASFTGTFWGPFGAALNNMPLPPALIKKHAGEKWIHHEVRQGITEIDQLVKHYSDDGGSGDFTFDASNLILFLQGKVYADYSCNAITAEIPGVSIVQIRFAVRLRLLEFLMELERTVPSTADLHVTKPALTQQIDTDNVEAAFHATIQIPRQH